MISLNYKVIPTEEIEINPYEVANRLKIPRDFELDIAKQCLERLKAVVNCKMVAARVPIVRLGENRLECGFGEFESEVLLKNLKNSAEAFVFSVTLGMGVDRLLTRLSLTSGAEFFVTDGLASAVAEAAAEKAEEIIKGGILCRPRFSPGFGDFKIELQPRILKLLNAQKLLGITINDVFLMTPQKTVTAIMGIIPQEDTNRK